MIRPPTRLSADGWRWLCVGVGVALRVIPWARNPPLWQDEAALVLNVIHLDFADYFGPLIHHQAAPSLFLAMERIALLVLGDSELALRLPILLLGCLSLVLFALVARRSLDPVPAAVATGLFAVSDRLIWHATEVKPYAVDALVAVLVAWVYVRTRHRSFAAQCGLWTILLPVLVWFSYPTCFVAGGLLLGLLPAAIRSSWTGRLAYLVAGVVMAGSFAVLALGPARAQRDAALTDYWVSQLADWNRPFHVPVWAVGALFEVDRYALMPVGQALLPLAVVGALRMARSDRRLLTVLLAPCGLTLLAALLGRYPFGGGRVNVFLAPGFILLVAAGVVPAWTWLWHRLRPAVAVLIALVAIPLGQTVYRTATPWPRPDFREPTAFVFENGEADDSISGDHWELLFYTRHQPHRYFSLADITRVSPRRVWVVTGTDPGVAEAVVGRVPSAWRRADARMFQGTIAVLMERTEP